MTRTNGHGVAREFATLRRVPIRTLRAALLAAAFAVGASAPALATSPSVETVAINVTFTPPALSAACGFAVTRRVVGTVTVRTFFDQGGDFTRELDTYLLTETLTANGHTLIGRTTQSIFVTLLADDGFTVTFVGSDFRLSVPGSGISFGSVGRLSLLFSADNELLDVLQDVGDVRADFTPICAALSAQGN